MVHEAARLLLGSARARPRGAIVGIGNGNFRDASPDPKAEVVCLALDGGGIAWRYPLRDAVLAAALVWKDRAYVGDGSGEFTCLDANTGKLLWRTNCGNPVLSSAAVAGEHVVYGCQGGHVHAVRATDGVEEWTYSAKWDAANGAAFTSSPAVADGRLFIGCDNFYFYCLGRK